MEHGANRHEQRTQLVSTLTTTTPSGATVHYSSPPALLPASPNLMMTELLRGPGCSADSVPELRTSEVPAASLHAPAWIFGLTGLLCLCPWAGDREASSLCQSHHLKAICKAWEGEAAQSHEHPASLSR